MLVLPDHILKPVPHHARPSDGGWASRQHCSGLLWNDSAAGLDVALDAQALAYDLVVIHEYSTATVAAVAGLDVALDAQARRFGLRVEAALHSALHPHPAPDGLVMIHVNSIVTIASFNVALDSYALAYGLVVV